MNKKVIALCILVCAAVLFCLTGCSSDSDTAAASPDKTAETSSSVNSGKTPVQPEYETFKVEYQSLKNIIRLDGVLRNGETHQLCFNVSGLEVSMVHVQKDDFVEKGDVLVELDTSELEKMLELKEMLRKKVLLQIEELQEKADIDGFHDEYSEKLASLELETIDGDIAGIQKKISNCVIVSPVSGRVRSIDAQDGDISQVYRPFIEIDMENGMQFLADPVTITDVYNRNAVNALVLPAGLEKGMQGVIRYDLGNGNMKDIKCTVQSIRFPLIEANIREGEADYDYRRLGRFGLLSKISVQADLDESFYADLSDDTKAVMFLDTGIERKALVVPADCVQNTFNERNVFVLERVKATERFVRTGIWDEEKNLVEIQEGLSEGELVVINP